MKVLVVYSSRETGNTKKLAEAIAARFGENCDLFPAAEAPDPAGYDFLAIGFGVYKGLPDGDMRAFMKRCRRKPAGIFMTLGAWPDSEHAHRCIGRAEGLLENCTIKVTFVCQGGYTQEYLERMRNRPANSPHAWNEERAARVAEAMKHPDEADCRECAERFFVAAQKLAEPKIKEGKRARILAVFGSSVPTAARAYDRMEEALKRDGLPVFRTCTSGMVRRKLGGSVPSLPALLKRLVLEGYAAADVTAGFLAPGEEYHKVKRDLSAFSGELEISVSRPPLASLETLECFLDAVMTAIPPERTEDEDVIFMGHGNHDGRSDFQYMAAAALLARRDAHIHLACVEGNPAFETVKVSSRRVWLIPFMLVAGDHALNDMNVKWKRVLEHAGHQVECVLHGLGENPRVAEYYAR